MGTQEQLNDLRSAVTTDSLIPQLQHVVEKLVSLHRELASLLSAEKRGKIEAWMHNNVDTIGARDRIAEFHAIDTTSEIFRVKGEISSYTEERDFLRLLIGLSNA